MNTSPPLRPRAAPTLVLLAALITSLELPAAESADASNTLRIISAADADVVGVRRAPASDVTGKGELTPREAVAATWHTDYSAALAAAARENKLVLLNFTGSDWCGWCMRLEADVFSKREFASYAARNLVLVKLDFPRKTQLPPAVAAQNARLRQQFGVRGFPTLIAVDGTGRKVAEIVGYVRGGPKAFLAALQKQTRL